MSASDRSRCAAANRELRENQIASIHVYGLAGDEATARAAQEAHHGGDFFRFTLASQRDLAFGVHARTAVGRPRRVDASGRHTVHTDAVLREFFRERAREAVRRTSKMVPAAH